MEKIKEALKKARATTSSGSLVTKPSIKSGSLSHRHDEVLEKIVYNQENVIDVDERVLVENRIVALNKMHPASWVYDNLRTQVLQIMEENDWRTVAIISPTAESGKTVTAINLGITIAQSPQKTAMVVDFDFRKPKVAKYLGISAAKSMNDFLSNDAELSEVIINPNIPRFTVLPTQEPVKNSSEVLSRSKISNLISDVANRYDSRVVLFDLPPILQADDAMVVLPHVDCALLVISDGTNSESELNQVMRLIGKCNILGCVVNRSDEVVTTSY